jgi:hypothetical protein
LGFSRWQRSNALVLFHYQLGHQFKLIEIIQLLLKRRIQCAGSEQIENIVLFRLFVIGNKFAQGRFNEPVCILNGSDFNGFGE